MVLQPLHLDLQLRGSGLILLLSRSEQLLVELVPACRIGRLHRVLAVAENVSHTELGPDFSRLANDLWGIDLDLMQLIGGGDLAQDGFDKIVGQFSDTGELPDVLDAGSGC